MSNNFTARRGAGGGGGVLFLLLLFTRLLNSTFFPLRTSSFSPGSLALGPSYLGGREKGRLSNFSFRLSRLFNLVFIEILSGVHSKVQKLKPLKTFRSRASSVSSGCSTPSSASSSPSSESSSNVPSSSSSSSSFSPFHSCSTEQFWNQYRRRPPTTSMTKMLKKALTSRLPSRYINLKGRVSLNFFILS